MNKKILYVIMIIITLIGAIIVGTKGFEFDIALKKTKMIEIYLGKEFEINDIENITNEVMPGKEVKLNKIGEFENTVAITLEEITEEEFDLLIQKVNEKYELENKREDILSIDLANIRLRDIVKSYVIPTIIVTIISLGYYLIVFRKIGNISIIIRYILNVLLPEITIISLYAILGLKVVEYTITIFVLIYSILLIIESYNLKLRLDKIKLEEIKK